MLAEFELEYDVEAKAQEVRDKVAAVRGELPRDLDPPLVDRVDPDAAPILAVMIAGPHSIRTLSEFADKRLKPRLERLPGVGRIQLVGHRPREIRVWLDPLRLAGYSLAVDDVIGALEREHVELAAGRLEAPSGEWTLRTRGKLTRPDQFGRLVVAQRDGRRVHLEDVAAVEDGMGDERTLSRLNGRRGVALLVRRRSGENTVAVADAVKAELARARSELPAGYELVTALDTSLFIRSAVRDVVADLAYGALLAAAIVVLFLRSVRSTAITAVAIPCSLVASFAFFYFFGFTLNTMTLMALSLSIGLLIDDAIVVLEAAYRRIEAGDAPAEAASRGTDEIGLAVAASTFVVCAVFVPIAFMSGVVGRFFREFGLIAASAVLASMLVALALTPMLCARYLRLERRGGRGWDALEVGWRRLERGYRWALGFGLRHSPTVVALAFASVAGGALAAGLVPRAFVIGSDRSEFNVWLETPLGASLAQTKQAVAAVEAELRRIPEVRLTGYTDLWLSYETGRPEIALEIARERAADLGVPVLQIGRTVAALYAGLEVTALEEAGERYPVRVQLLPEYRDDLAKLELVRVRSPGGALVPLANLVEPRIGSGAVQIDREDRARAITVYANLGEKAAGTADAEVQSFVAEMRLEPSTRFDAVGPARRLRETFSAVLFAFFLALVAIYMILAAQFDSFVHPLTIMLSAPLSFIGAFAALALLGHSLDAMGQIAFLMLMGIVMKNGILLVDCANALRARGRGALEAALEAGRLRLRPVLMTAVSTVFGMIPVAFGRGDGSEWRGPMGVVCIGGLVTSTFLTLLVVPVVYTLVDGATAAVRRAAGRTARPRLALVSPRPAPRAAPNAASERKDSLPLPLA